MKAAVILAGSGVYDGSEIQEAVLSLLALAENGVEYSLFAPNKNQLHVINHLTGEEMEETRNVLTESARIGRGNVADVKTLSATAFDFLVIPGGFGAAKNLNQWAIKGPDGDIDEDIKKVILEFVNSQLPICALCMGPTVVAKALENSEYKAKLTVGSTVTASPYDIAGISGGMESIGATSVEKTIEEVAIDNELKIVSAPCYMMEASLLEVRSNIASAIKETVALVK